MPTVIDSLIVTLGLDPADFTKGQKTAAAAFTKTKEQAASAGKSIEESSKKAADSIDRVAKSVLGLAAIFLGARGITEFVANITQADAALGRFAANLGQSPQVIAAWEMAAQRMGGSAEATASTFERIGKALYDLHRNGTMLPKEYSQLSALTNMPIDRDHGVDKFLDDTAAALQKLNAVDPSQAHFLAQGMGIDDATANVMIKYGSGVQAYLKGLQQYAPSDQTIKNLQALQDQWNTLQQKVVSFATAITGDLAPVLKPFLQDFSTWTDDLIKAEPSIATFAKDAADVANSLGQWRIAIDALVALWAGGKMVGMVGGIGRMLGMGGGAAEGAAAGAAGGALGWALGVGAIAATTMSGGPLTYSQDDFKRMLANSQNFGRGMNSSGSPDDRGTLVNGQPVSKANPLPVMPVDQNGGGNWLSNLGNAVGGFFGGIGRAMGGGGAAAPAMNSSASPDDRSAPPAPGGGGGGKGWWTPERQKWAYDRLRNEAGLSDAGAKGLVARWMYVEAPDGPNSVNPSNGAWGIEQALGGRRNGLFAKYGQTKDPNEQMSWIIHELMTSESDAARKLRTARTEAQGAVAASTFERAGGWNGQQDSFVDKTLQGMPQVRLDIQSAAAAAAATTANMLNWARLSTVQNTHQVTTSSSSNEVHVGALNVTVPGGDANGIVNGITPALKRGAMAWAANYGPA